jgi:hypothetical protein
VDDRSADRSERVAHPCDRGKDRRRAGDLERLAVEGVPLHVDRDEGGVGEAKRF